jgi:hypothetical protein
MDRIYQQAIEEELEQLKTNLNKIKKLSNITPVWSPIVPITNKLVGVENVIGCYKVIYKDKKVMGIGQGVIANRKCKHLQVFRNGGIDIIHPNGTSSGSALAGYMYKHDKNINNWYFSWCNIGNSNLSKSYEYFLQLKYRPKFNLI